MYSIEGWTGLEGLNPDTSATADDDGERKVKCQIISSVILLSFY
jgi:hypothetical protein